MQKTCQVIAKILCRNNKYTSEQTKTLYNIRVHKYIMFHMNLLRK